MNGFLLHAHRRRTSTAGAAALILLSAALAVPRADAESAGGPGVFDMHVVSNGMAVHIHDPNLVLQPDVAFGPYAALASLDNLGASTATAGAPFLGDYIGPLVGHFNGLGSGQIPPFPPVPGEVHSSYPGQPSALQRNGGYSVQAQSSQNESKAVVNLGATSPGAENGNLFSVSHVLVDGSGTLNAVGASGVDLLNIGGVLDIGRVASNITLTDSGSGEPKFTTTTDVGTIKVSGQTFGLDQHGLTATGSNAGPSSDQVNQATEALKQGGITIRYVPASTTYVPGTHTVQSMESGAVEVSYEHEVPSQGLTTTTYTLGYVALTATHGGGSAASSGTGDATSGGTATAPADPTTAPMPPGRSTPSRNPVAVAAVPAREASAARPHRPSADAGDPSVAILTPTLRILHFGAAVGTPDTCNIIFGTLGTGATQAGVGAGSAPALGSGVEQCVKWSNAGGDQISGAMPQLAPLAVINPAVNPGIDAFADAFESIGRDHADAVAPFGPTIAGLARSARFFKG